MRLLPFMQTDDPTQRARRRFMRDMQPDGIGAVLLSLADRRALRSTPELDDDAEMLKRMDQLLRAGREAAPTDAEPNVPITGADLIALGLKPGPSFGEILRAAEEEWVSGRLATREQALAWVRERFAAKGS